MATVENHFNFTQFIQKTNAFAEYNILANQFPLLKWAIRGTGCHNFKVIAFDAAGNETESTAVPICLVERGE